MQSGTVLGGEELDGGDEGGCVGAEVGEEERQRVHDYEEPDGDGLDLVDCRRQDDQNDRHDGETWPSTHRHTVSFFALSEKTLSFNREQSGSGCLQEMEDRPYSMLRQQWLVGQDSGSHAK